VQQVTVQNVAKVVDAFMNAQLMTASLNSSTNMPLHTQIMPYYTPQYINVTVATDGRVRTDGQHKMTFPVMQYVKSHNAPQPQTTETSQ